MISFSLCCCGNYLKAEVSVLIPRPVPLNSFLCRLQILCQNVVVVHATLIAGLVSLYAAFGSLSRNLSFPPFLAQWSPNFCLKNSRYESCSDLHLNKLLKKQLKFSMTQKLSLRLVLQLFLLPLKYEMFGDSLKPTHD